VRPPAREPHRLCDELRRHGEEAVVVVEEGEPDPPPPSREARAFAQKIFWGGPDQPT